MALPRRDSTPISEPSWPTSVGCRCDRRGRGAIARRPSAMTTICVARKAGQVAIAADALVTFGDTRLAHGYEANDKVFRIGDSWVGMAGTTAHFPVLRRALGALPKPDLKLG